MTTPIKPGAIINDRYRVKEAVGAGGQGEVFRVEDIVDNNKTKALKTLREEILPQNLKRMKTEVRALQTVQSTGVITILDTNLDQYSLGQDIPPYFVTEYARFGTLKKHNYFNGEIDLSLRLFRRICEGVKAVHAAGVIHRDLKPSNILLFDNEKDIRIGDFGICYVDLEEDEERATRIREKVGPLYFSAPEQTSLPPSFTKKSDIYSLGRILHFMITGVYEYAPGEDYTPISIHLGMKSSHPVDGFIQKATSFDPKYRQADVDSVISNIDELLGKIDNDTPKFRMSKLQARIMKYIQSDLDHGADLEDILHYLKNFYQIDYQPMAFQNPLIYTGIRWSEFANRVEIALEQLEEANLLEFRRGNYSSK